MSIDFETCDYNSKYYYRMDEVNEIGSKCSSGPVHDSKSPAKRRSNGNRVASIVESLSNRLHMNKKKKTRPFEYANDGGIQFGCFPRQRKGIPKNIKEFNENLTPWQAGSWDKPRTASFKTDSSDKLSSGF